MNNSPSFGVVRTANQEQRRCKSLNIRQHPEPMPLHQNLGKLLRAVIKK